MSPYVAFFIGLIGPDLALLLGASRGLAPGQLHPRAVPLYNALHRAWAPLALVALSAAGLLPTPWLVLGAAWLVHIGVDRLVGYGLRTPEGFQRG